MSTYKTTVEPAILNCIQRMKEIKERKISQKKIEASPSQITQKIFFLLKC